MTSAVAPDRKTPQHDQDEEQSRRRDQAFGQKS
jgi:hypothetical protein